MSKGKVVILGVTGHVGQVVAQAFVAKGWDVTGMTRSDRQIREAALGHSSGHSAARCLGRRRLRLSVSGGTRRWRIS